MASSYRDEKGTMGYNCVSRISTEKSQLTDGMAIWYKGAVLTPDGIVNVIYSDPPRGSHSGTTLMEFVHGGTCYRRQWSSQFQPRYLVNLARKFAAEIAQGGQGDGE